MLEQTISPGLGLHPSVPTSASRAINQIKVLHVVNGEHFSGAERVQSHLGRCLPQFDVAADFACVKPGKFAEMVDEQQGKWGTGFRTNMNHRFDLRPVRFIRDLVHEHHYDMLHAHTPRTAMVASMVSKWTGVPWIYHVHSPASRDSTRFLTNQINAWIEKQTFRNCKHLITVSESLRLDCIRQGVSEDKVTVVHNGVPAIRPPRQNTPKVGGTWTIGMIALMRPRKGLEIAIDAIAELDRRGHDVRLRVIGPFESEEYRSEIEARIATKGVEHRLERVGFVDDVPLALSKLDAMVLPSLFGEGLPMVVLEAMAAAVPVVATRVEGTPEAITHGLEGLLAEPRNALSLAREIESLVAGEYDWTQMSEAAFDRHRRSFSDLAMARDTAAVYRSLSQPKAMTGSSRQSVARI